MSSFDHIIVGTGQATGTLLTRLIPTGESIAVIEGADVGGTCVNFGCTPTKTLVASAKVAYQVARAAEFGISVQSSSVDFRRVRSRMNEVRHGSRDGLTRWMEESNNVTLIRGWASFTGPRALRVGDLDFRGERIYLNVGARPSAPPIPGLDAVPWMDSKDLLALEALPEHLIIIGGGYIGLEFAQIFRRFGCSVTVLQRSDQLMTREDADIAGAVQSILEEEGVQIHLGAGIERVRQDSGIVVDTSVRGTATEIRGSHLLVAAGRRSNSDRLGLQNTSIRTNRHGFIQVDDYCRTDEAGVFALGDVNGHGAFTHTSVNDAEIVLDHLYGGIRKISDRIPIYALFTDPPLGRVGMSEKEALAMGRPLLKAIRPMSRISRAKEMGETRGFAKLLVDAESDLIVGASILGVGGDEIINMFAAIMHSQIPCKNYRRVVLVHPTVSELMPWMLDGLAPVDPLPAD